MRIWSRFFNVPENDQDSKERRSVQRIDTQKVSRVRADVLKRLAGPAIPEEIRERIRTRMEITTRSFGEANSELRETIDMLDQEIAKGSARRRKRNGNGNGNGNGKSSAESDG